MKIYFALILCTFVFVAHAMEESSRAFRNNRRLIPTDLHTPEWIVSKALAESIGQQRETV